MNNLRFRVHLSEEAIVQYAASIEAPLQRIGTALVAPSTMPITFWKIADAPWLHMPEPLIHGTQQFHYEAPLTSGMELDCDLSLTRVENKTGRQGALTLYTHSLICTCAGKRIVTVETVLISVGDK